MIGDGETYQSWTVDVANLGGVATTWPFGWNGSNSGPYTGAPAARFDSATFQQLLSSGVIQPSDPAGVTSNQQWWYVLAPASVVNTAPTETQESVAAQLEDFLLNDWGSALAQFPSQLQTEINGTIGYAGNILSTAASTAAGVVKAAVSPLLTTPVLIAAGVVGLVALGFVFRKK